MRGRVCHLSESQSAVISLLLICTVYILYVIKCIYKASVSPGCIQIMPFAFSVKVKVTLWLIVSQSVSLGVEPHLGLLTRYLLLFWQLRSCFSSQSHIATDSQSVSLGVEPHLGLMTRYLLLFDSYSLVLSGALSDERTDLFFKVKVTLRLMVSQSVSLGVKPHLGLMARYLILFDSYGLVFAGRPLWREDGCVFFICCWPLPAQSFSGPNL
jgi:hypothetical protein